MKRVLKFLAIALVMGLVVVGVLVWREASVGTGPIVTAASPPAGAREVAFVANAVGGSVTMYDLDANEVIGTINTVPDGRRMSFFRSPVQALYVQDIYDATGVNHTQDVDISPDGRVLYVSRGNLGDVVAFDLLTGEMMWRRFLGPGRSDHMAITPDGRYLFVSVMGQDHVARIDTRTAEVDGTFKSGPHPHDLQVTRDGSRVFNASLGDMAKPVAERGVAESDAPADIPYQITEADVATMEVIARHRFPRGIRPFHLSPDERRVYAQLSNQHAVITYDLGTDRIVQTLNLPVKAGVTEDDWAFDAPHHGLAMTEDGTILCLAGRASDYAAIVSTEPLELVATVPTGDAPSWAVFDRAGERCLLANTREDTVSVVSIAEQREIARFRTGRAPKVTSVAMVGPAVLQAIRERNAAAR